VRKLERYVIVLYRLEVDVDAGWQRSWVPYNVIGCALPHTDLLRSKGFFWIATTEDSVLQSDLTCKKFY
jgi:hypothetical protein